MSDETYRVLEVKVDTIIDAMKMSIEQEDYAEFFELFGDIYCELNTEFTKAVNTKAEEADDLYDLIFSTLIPDSVDLMKETWIMTN